MNFFIEGLQGSGKSTLVNKISKKYPDHTMFREGDYSPVELAWCAYVTEEEYHFPSLRKSFFQGTRGGMEKT